MRKLLLGASIAAAGLWSGQALAEPPTQPGAVNPPAATTGAAADATATTGLKVGLTVKDSTGATVGHLTELKADASGKQMATIHTDSGQVALEASRLTVKDGAAVVDATKAELQSMAKKPKG